MFSTILGEKYPHLLCDLDGTIYNGSIPLEPAIKELQTRDPASTYFVTNNGSRTPQVVAQKLAQFGLQVTADQIVTSAQGIAQIAKKYLEPSDLIYVLGSASLCTALENEGFKNFITVDQLHLAQDETSYRELINQVHHCRAVIQSLNPQTSWQNLADAAIAIHHGALWFASNNDSTLPSDQGLLLGNGAFVYALGTAVQPKTYITAGKPDKALLEMAIERFRQNNSTNPKNDSVSDLQSTFLMIGDRLNTDIAAGVNTGVDTLCVLTGVSSLADVLSASTNMMPTYIAQSCQALSKPIADSYICPQPHWVTYWNEASNILQYENTAESSLWSGILAILAEAKKIPDHYKSTLKLIGAGNLAARVQELFDL